MNQLNTEQLTTLKKRLVTQRQDLLKEIQEELRRNNLSELNELASEVHDRGEESTANLLNDIEDATIQLHQQTLSQLESALNNMATGSYSICVDCSCEIPYERLHAYPSAQRCMDCQQQHERQLSTAQGSAR